MQKVKSVKYNGHQCGNSHDGFDFDFQRLTVGDVERASGRTVRTIQNCYPTNGLQQHNVWVDFDNGESLQIFNICEIEYFPNT